MLGWQRDSVAHSTLVSQCPVAVEYLSNCHQGVCEPLRGLSYDEELSASPFQTMPQGLIESQGMFLKQLDAKKDAAVAELVPSKEAFASLQWAAGQLVSGPVVVLYSVGPLYPGDIVVPAVLQTSNLRVGWEVLMEPL